MQHTVKRKSVFGHIKGRSVLVYIATFLVLTLSCVDELCQLFWYAATNDLKCAPRAQ